MRILITGGTGFIGRHWVERRLAMGDDVTVLTRRPNQNQPKLAGATLVSHLSETDSEGYDLIVNLAGEPIADRRWSAEQKDRLIRSRVDFTVELVNWLEQQTWRPQALLSGSAIGFYGADLTDRVVTESSEPKSEFTHQLCEGWENAALRATDLGIRVCLLRTGVVIGKDGGAMAKMLLPFKMGLGGPIATGNQWFSWIALSDYLNALDFLVGNGACSGAYNLTAPHPVTNQEFSRRLGAYLHRPACLRTPEFVFKLMLGEGYRLLTEGQRVLPERLTTQGFQFSHPHLDEALAAELG